MSDVELTEVYRNLLDRYLNFDIPATSELRGIFNHTMEAYYFRKFYIANIAFPLYTRETVNVLIHLLKDKKILEVGSGIGYLATILQNNGLDITTVDDQSTAYLFGRSRIIKCDYQTSAIPKIRAKYDAIIMSWPDYDNDFAFKVASKMSKGQMLVYQGEGNGGCTGNSKFFSKLDKNFVELDDFGINDYHTCFSGIYDYWNFYRKVKNW